jgi:hypothetical protein
VLNAVVKRFSGVGDRGHVRWFPRRQAGAPRMGRHSAWRLGHWWARACYARGQTIHWLLAHQASRLASGRRPHTGEAQRGGGSVRRGMGWGQRAQLAGPGRLARRARPRAAQKGGRWSSQGGRRWAWGAGSWTRAGPGAAIGEGLVCFYFLFLFFVPFI